MPARSTAATTTRGWVPVTGEPGRPVIIKAGKKGVVVVGAAIISILIIAIIIVIIQF